MANKENNFMAMIKAKMQEANSVLESNVDIDDPGLAKQITLGDNWDNPNEILRALDRQSVYYARWAYRLKQLKQIEKMRTQKFNIWVSTMKKKVEEIIYSKNIKSGMTPNNAKPSASSVDNYFNSKFHEGVDAYDKYYIPVKTITSYMNRVEIIVEAFKQRADMLTSMTILMNKMLDKELLTVKSRKQK